MAQKNDNAGDKTKKFKAKCDKMLAGNPASPFELPRQQREEGAKETEPEIMQFKASQKLLSPNTSQESTTTNGKQQYSKDTVDQRKKSNKNDQENKEATHFSAEEKRKMEETAVIQKFEKEDFPFTFKTNKDIEYMVLDEIGWGTSSKVYKVMDSSNKTYALKLCENANEIFNDCQVVKLANSINSPYFGAVYEGGKIGKKYYLIFKLLGPTLAKAIEKASITSKYVAAIQTLQALDDLHKIGFIHNDVKDDNYCIAKPGTAEAGQIFLIDFGRNKTIEEHKIQEGTEEADEIITRRDELITWLEMVASWFNVELESMNSKEHEKENMNKNYQMMAQISPGFQTIFLFIEFMERGQADYGLIIMILKLELQKLTGGRPFKLDWCPDTDYKEPPTSTISTFNPKYYSSDEEKEYNFDIFFD